MTTKEVPTKALYEGAVKFEQSTKYRAVECQTLGTYWRDIEDEHGNVFAIQVQTELAEAFVKEPWKYGNVFAWIPKLRTWALEAEHRYLYESKRETDATPDELLMDVWHSQSHPTSEGGRWAGGDSTLEAIQVYLDKRGFMDSKGNIIWNVARAGSGDATPALDSPSS